MAYLGFCRFAQNLKWYLFHEELNEKQMLLINLKLVQWDIGQPSPIKYKKCYSEMQQRLNKLCTYLINIKMVK